MIHVLGTLYKLTRHLVTSSMIVGDIKSIGNHCKMDLGSGATSFGLVIFTRRVSPQSKLLAHRVFASIKAQRENNPFVAAIAAAIVSI